MDLGGEPDPVVDIMKRMSGSDIKFDCREVQQGNEQGEVYYLPRDIYRYLIIDN